VAVLVTGGTGYIGSHTLVSLLESNHEVIVLDSLINSSRIAIGRVAQITGKYPKFVEGNIADRKLLTELFESHNIESVIHFAGLKAVGESAKVPLLYYRNNVAGTINLLECMIKANVKALVFSSSATVYGEDAPVPYVETTPRGKATSPYGATKSMIETILEDLAMSDSDWRICALRYFNPIGSHPSGLIGEAPIGIPNNLIPYISQVAVGRREKLSIFGGDYPTPDGTCRRDYLHVVDLAEGHVAALNYLDYGFNAINLGTGKPTSVLELLNTFESTNGLSIPYEFVARRSGDLHEFWADASKAETTLNWKARRSLTDMVADTWNWQIKNPDGYV